MSPDQDFWQEVPSPNPLSESPSVPSIEPVPSPEPPPPTNKLGWLERLLDPATLQRMMLCGGGLLVLGFVVWLWSCGIFENPLVLAWSVGLTNLSLIATGVFLVTRTRYQLSGQGLALLGSLALPLNLWHYEAQNLIVLSAGGHLWVPALACCLIYAGIARVLRNPHFVYALIGGVILTGLLLLADTSVNRFWELLPVTTLLVTVGSLAVLSAHSFPETGDFSQQRFGLAARRSGWSVLASGLALLGGGQLLAIFASSLPFMQLLDSSLLGNLSFNTLQDWWAFGLTSGALLLVTGDWYLRRQFWKLTAMLLLTGWCLINLTRALEIALTIQALAIGLSILAIGLNLIKTLATPPETEVTRQFSREQLYLSLLSWGLAVWGIAKFAVDVNFDITSLPDQNTTLWTAVQLFLAGLACWTSDRIWTARLLNDRVLLPVYLGAVAISLGTLAVLAQTSFSSLPLAILGPTCVALAIAIAGFWTDYRALPSLRHASLGSIITIFLVCFWAYPTNQNLFAEEKWIWIALAIANATVCGWQTYFQRSAAASVCFFLLIGFTAAESLSLTTLNFDYSLLIALTSIGLLNQIFLRLSGHGGEEEQTSSIGGNLIALSGGLGSILLCLSEAASGAAILSLAGLLMLQAVLHGALGMLGHNQAWKMTFRILAGGCFACMILILALVSDLNPSQKLELFASASGLLTLGLSHLGLYREQSSGTKDETVSLGLWLGSLLTVVPALIGLFVYCSAVELSPLWLYGHEIGVLLTGLVLFGIGSLLQTRATTLVGGGTLALYVASLLFLVPWPDQLQSTSVLMMLFGGLFFGLAILLSIYRDRLSQLPEKIKQGQGMYRVFKWR